MSKVLVVMLGLVCFMTSCLGQTKSMAEQISPIGEYKAELLEGDTGAVGGWISVIRVTEINPTTWDKLSGNAQETVFGADVRSTHIGFIWQGNRHLEITCGGCLASGIELQKKSWKDVVISYEITETEATR